MNRRQRRSEQYGQKNGSSQVSAQGIGDYIALAFIIGMAIFAVGLVVRVAQRGELRVAGMTILVLMGANIFGILAIDLLSNCIRMIRRNGLPALKLVLLVAELCVLVLLLLVPRYVPGFASFAFWLFAGLSSAETLYVYLKLERFE